VIRRAGLALAIVLLLLITLADIQSADDRIEAGEARQVMEIQRGN
jgi:hypothetical protein